MGSNPKHLAVVFVTVLLVFGAVPLPTVYAQDDCKTSTEELAISYGFTRSTSGTTAGAAVVESARNYTSYDAESGSSRLDLGAEAANGLASVLSVGRSTLSAEWTAPCTGSYTVRSEFELSGRTSQHREAGPFGNGVSRTVAESRLVVYDSTEDWNLVAIRNETAWDAIIPELSDLETDAIINVFEVAVEELTGLPVGDMVAEQAGIERDATSIERQLSTPEGEIAVTFRAEKGHSYVFAQESEAGVIVASIGAGSAEGSISVLSEIDRLTISPETGGSVVSESGEGDAGDREMVDATIESSDVDGDAYATGQRVTTNVTVRNTGEQEHTLFVGYRVVDPNGTVRTNQVSTAETVTLAPGETGTVTVYWYVERDAPTGSYDVHVAVWQDRIAGNLQTMLDDQFIENAFEVT